ncbi:hypothetical protein [Prevotella sp. KH2C16]|uniref:hypothetical protein n=1 Tax=Prevotella sp. KH2C16 TaxID=1855325 RepID=UPI001160891A|nr:hypothetical protein [Prevotella sp. KH2C16]
MKRTGMPVRRELRQIQNAMSSMLANGVSPTADEYRKLAARAGQLRDAMADVDEEIRAQANDTRNMTLAFGAFGDGISLLQGYQSAMSLFGGSNETAAKAIQKMMAAQQLLNVVQKLGTDITSKSTIIGKGYLLVKNAIAGAAHAQAAGEVVATVATNGLAKATKGATAAQVALRAVSKGGVWGIAAAGIAAVGVAIYKAYQRYKTAEEEAAKHAEAMRSRLDSLSEEVGKVTGKYFALQAQYRVLRDEHSKTAWIKENQSAFKELGIRINDIADAERLFVSNSGAVVKALIDRSVAAAKAALAQQKYMDALKGKSVIAGQEIGEEFTKEQRRELYGKGYIGRERGSETVHWTEEGARARNAYLLGKAERDLRKELLSITRDQVDAQNRLDSLSGKEIKAEKKKTKKEKASGTKKDATDSIRTLAEADALIESLNAAIAKTPDIHKKLSLDKELKEVEAFRKQVQGIIDDSAWKQRQSVLKDMGGLQPSDIGTLSVPAFDLGKLNDITDAIREETNRQAEAWNDLQESIRGFKDNLGGDATAITGTWIALAKTMKSSRDTLTNAASGLVVLGDSLRQLGSNGAIAKAGAVMAAIGQIILGFASASAQAAAHNPYAWLAFLGAGLAAASVAISTIESFNTGGVVQGSSYTGDHVPAMLNSGEMVLTTAQSANLFRAIKSNALGGGINGDVRFEIEGTKLVGVLRNQNSKTGKIR